MAISITRISLGSRDFSGDQLADRIDVADGTVTAALPGGLYRIYAKTASIVRVGNALANANGGEEWPAGLVDHRSVPNGFVVACNAG